MSDSVSDEEIRKNLGEQLNEFEILACMYPGDRELSLGDPAVIHDVQEYLQGKAELPNKVHLTLRLSLCEQWVELCVQLPHTYPSASLPEIYIRSDSLSRDGQRRVNDDVQAFLAGSECVAGEPCLCAVISWLQGCADDHFTPPNRSAPPAMAGGGVVATVSKFSRYWIYSHHIYSKVKRKNMLDMSKEYQLTGFCLPGKPGIICIEGNERNCSDWWSVVKNWNWKRLSLKIQEDEEGELESFRLFDGFVEIGSVKGGSRDFHMDMAAFQTYLEDHGCQHIFPQLFGIEK